MRVRNGYKALVLLAAAMLGGCATYVAHRIQAPDSTPSRAERGYGWILRAGQFQRASVVTAEGVRIAYWLGRPRAYDWDLRFEVGNGDDQGKLGMGFSFKDIDGAGEIPALGTVVLLHGWELDGSSLTFWAMTLAKAGYVVVMPDLRSHGDSSRVPVGYGPREAGDIADLIHQLRQRDALPGPLYLFGMSYGATAALFAEPRVPDLQGVIALEPYANAAATIRRAPQSGLFAKPWMRWLASDRVMRRALDKAGRDLHLDLASIMPADALVGMHPCTVLVRGTYDELTSAEELQSLAAQSPRAEFVVAQGEDHVSLGMRVDRVAPAMVAWMRDQAKDATQCRSFPPLRGEPTLPPGLARPSFQGWRAWVPQPGRGIGRAVPGGVRVLPRVSTTMPTPTRMIAMPARSSGPTCSPASSTPNSTATGGLT